MAHQVLKLVQQKETTIVRSHNKQLNLFNKYLLLVTFETNDNYSIRFEMQKHYSHSTNHNEHQERTKEPISGVVIGASDRQVTSSTPPAGALPGSLGQLSLASLRGR